MPFEGVQQRLLNYLQPMMYADDLARHRSRFTGRDWLKAEMEGWLASTKRVLWITGEAGTSGCHEDAPGNWSRLVAKCLPRRQIGTGADPGVPKHCGVRGGPIFSTASCAMREASRTRSMTTFSPVANSNGTYGYGLPTITIH